MVNYHFRRRYWRDMDVKKAMPPTVEPDIEEAGRTDFGILRHLS